MGEDEINAKALSAANPGLELPNTPEDVNEASSEDWTEINRFMAAMVELEKASSSNRQQ